MISLKRYSTSGANAFATSSEITNPNASAIVWMDAAERCVKSLGVVDILFVLLRKKVEERRLRESLRITQKKSDLLVKILQLVYNFCLSDACVCVCVA